MCWTTSPLPKPPLCCGDEATHPVPSQLVVMQWEVVGWPRSLEEWMVYPWLGWLDGCGNTFSKAKGCNGFYVPNSVKWQLWGCFQPNGVLAYARIIPEKDWRGRCFCAVPQEKVRCLDATDLIQHRFGLITSRISYIVLWQNYNL